MSRRIPWVTLSLAGALIFGGIVSEPLKVFLSLGGGSGGGWRWWQALTCHTVHFGWAHFWRDVPALALLSVLLEAKSRPTLLAVLGIAAWVIPASVLLFEPDILPYRGSSGLVVAVFAWLGANAILRRDADWVARLTGVAALALLTAKIWLEMTEGRLMMESPGGAISISWSAHLAGALVGFFLALIKKWVDADSGKYCPSKNERA